MANKRHKPAEIIIEEWRKHYNTKRPHSALGYRPPAPETIVPMATRSYARKLVTAISGGVFDLLDAVFEFHSLDDLGELA